MNNSLTAFKRHTEIKHLTVSWCFNTKRFKRDAVFESFHGSSAQQHLCSNNYAECLVQLVWSLPWYFCRKRPRPDAGPGRERSRENSPRAAPRRRMSRSPLRRRSPSPRRRSRSSPRRRSPLGHRWWLNVHQFLLIAEDISLSYTPVVYVIKGKLWLSIFNHLSCFWGFWTFVLTSVLC